MTSLERSEIFDKLVAERNLLTATVVDTFMKKLSCKDVHELISVCETIIDAAKKSNYYLAE